MKKLYVVALGASKRNGDMSISIAVIRASSKEEAYGIARLEVQNKYPEKEGYKAWITSLAVDVLDAASRL